MMHFSKKRLGALIHESFGFINFMFLKMMKFGFFFALDPLKLFHKAGHILSYDPILQLDTGLAESVLNTLDGKSGTVIPPNLVQGNFVHILDETLDGRNTFHATQVAAWQRGKKIRPYLACSVNPSKKRSLNIPASLDKIETIVVRKALILYSLKQVRRRGMTKLKIGKNVNDMPKLVIWHSICYEAKV